MKQKKNILLWLSSNIYLIATAALQLFGFIILGRALGALEYGQILAVTVFVTLGAEFVGLGCGDSLIKKVSTEQHLYPALIRECIVLCIITLPIVSLIIIGGLAIFTTLDVMLISILVITELYSTRTLALIDHSSIARKDIATLNTVKITYAAIRLIVIASAAFIWSIHTAWQWIPFQIICSVGVSSCLFIYIVKRYGGIQNENTKYIQISESCLFSLTQTMRALQSNIDKYAVQFSFSPLIFSLYAVAGRFLQYSLIPLQAVLRISYPKFFEAEKKQRKSSLKLAIKLIPIILGASAIPFSFLMWGGFLIELLLGKSYIGVSHYMSLLAPIPVLLGLQYIFMDLLTALDAHKIRLNIAMIHVASLCCYFYFFSTHTAIEPLIYGFIGINGTFVLLYLLCALIRAQIMPQNKGLNNK